MTICSVVMGPRGADVTLQAGTTQPMFRNKGFANDPRLMTTAIMNFDLDVSQE